MRKSIHGPELAILTEILRERRLAAGLRQIDLAELLGTRQSFVSNYETGERRLDLMELRAVCEVLGVPLLKLVREFESRLSDGSQRS